MDGTTHVITSVHEESQKERKKINRMHMPRGVKFSDETNRQSCQKCFGYGVLVLGVSSKIFFGKPGNSIIIINAIDIFVVLYLVSSSS